jgi:hypothetical protein
VKPRSLRENNLLFRSEIRELMVVGFQKKVHSQIKVELVCLQTIHFHLHVNYTAGRRKSKDSLVCIGHTIEMKEGFSSCEDQVEMRGI